MSHLQDINVTVAESDCGMCGENKAPRTKEKAPETADRRYTVRMDRAGPLCALFNYKAKRYADQVQ